MLDERASRRRRLVFFLVLAKHGAVGSAEMAHARKLADAERSAARRGGGPHRGGGCLQRLGSSTGSSWGWVWGCWRSSLGSQSSQRGRYQFQSPSSFMVA